MEARLCPDTRLQQDFQQVLSICFSWQLVGAGVTLGIQTMWALTRLSQPLARNASPILPQLLLLLGAGAGHHRLQEGLEQPRGALPMLRAMGLGEVDFSGMVEMLTQLAALSTRQQGGNPF